MNNAVQITQNERCHFSICRKYTQCVWQSLGLSADLVITDSFETHIRFPKKKQTAATFEDIVSRFNPAAINGYDIKIIDNEVWITEKVNNILFKKAEQGQLPLRRQLYQALSYRPASSIALSSIRAFCNVSSSDTSGWSPSRMHLPNCSISSI